MNPHENPGTYIELSGEQTVRPQAALSSTVAVAQSADWGPMGVDAIQEFFNFGEAEQALGESNTPARRAILGNFIGSGVPEYPAAGTVKFFRMGTSAAAKATLTIANTAGSPAPALKLDAFYKGTRGNRLAALIEEDPANAANDQLRILFDGRTVERYPFTPTDVVGLVADINAKSVWVTATSLVTGTALNNISQTSLASGNDGSTLTSAEWAAAIQGFEFEDFSVFDAHGLTDAGIQATLAAWCEDAELANRPFTLVMGGGGSETLAQGLTRTALHPSPHIISVGVGSWHDDFLDETVISAQLTSRVAGGLAGAGEGSSLTNMPFAGLSAVSGGGVATDELATAWRGGLTTFKRVSDPQAKLVINKGVTTFTDTSDPNYPYELFSDPRIVRVADLFLRRMKAWGDRNIVGPTRVIEPTKAAVRLQGQDEIARLIRDGLIKPGVGEVDAPYFLIIDNPGEGLEDAIVFEFGWVFVRTTNYLIGKGRVR